MDLSESLSFLRASFVTCRQVTALARRPLYGSGTLTLWRRRRCRIQEASSPGKDICPCQSERLPSRLRLFPHDSFLSTVSRLVPIQYNFVVYTRAVACSFDSVAAFIFADFFFSLNNYKVRQMEFIYFKRRSVDGVSYNELKSNTNFAIVSYPWDNYPRYTDTYFWPLQ